MLEAADDLASAVGRASARYYPLVLVVGGHGSGKTTALKAFAASRDMPCPNLSLHLSTAMLAMTETQRRLQVGALVSRLVSDAGGEVVVLDNTELLHEPSLEVDPLKVLLAASRIRPVVAAWSGRLHGTTLLYAEPGHPEYREYENPDMVVVPVGNQGTVREDGSA